VLAVVPITRVRVDDLVADLELVVLREEAIPADHALLAGFDIADEVESGDPFARLDQVIERLLAEVVPEPPGGVRIATVPIEQARQQPSRLLPGVSIPTICG